MKRIVVTCIATLTTLFLPGCMGPEIRRSPTPSTLTRSEQWKEALIIEILRNTPELNIHQMNGQTENQVFVHQDGGEIVFNAEGERVTDPTNMGSYNYYDAVEEPLAHFAKDTDPWLKWGNARNDPSTPDQRLTAYLKDLKIGIIAAYNNRQVQVGKTTVSYNSKTERAVSMEFLGIIHKSGDLSLFDMYKNPDSATDEKIDRFLQNIKPTFRTKI